jgi:hypothetical protein
MPDLIQPRVDLICANHQCRAAFVPLWKGQIYCCNKCRTTERNWRKSHGEKAMNAALAGKDPAPVIADSIRSRG